MEPKERIIVALDVDSVSKAIQLVKDLALHVGGFKIGLELMTSMSASIIIPKNEEEAMANLRQIREFFALLGMKEFWDGKFMDIPNTVAGAVSGVSKIGVRMFNVHCLGGAEMMKKAREVAEKEALSKGSPRPLVIGVTLLTSLNYEALVEMGIMPPLNIVDPQERKTVETERIRELVKNLALLAQDSGMDGVVASPQEIEIIRRYCQPEFLVVTLGVRPVWAAVGDQRRVMTPGEAIKAGASYLVIGRPITQPPKEIGSPVDAVKKIVAEIEEAQRK